jgi:hypothetical protein
MIHRITINIFLALAATDFAAAFVLPTAIVPKARRIQSLTATAGGGAFEYNADVAGKGKLVVSFEPSNNEPPHTPKPTPPTLPNESFKGVKLPENEEVPPRVDNELTKNLVGQFLVDVAAIMGPMLGQPKSDGLPLAQKLVFDIALNGKVPDQEDYKFFGNRNHSENLTYLLKTNPFFASALTVRKKGGFELLSFDPKDPDNEKNTVSLFRKAIGTLSGTGRRVNFRFDDDMKITGFRVYDDITGTRIKEDDDDQDERACAAIYNVLFYSQNVHATIHVLHYLTTSAFQVASRDYGSMNEWATTYANNIVQKIEQVGQLLYVDAATGPAAALTGPLGLGGSQETRLLFQDVLSQWGQSPTAKGWLDCMMNIDPEKMESAGILTEFNKHCGLIEDFAKDTASALREVDQDKYTVADLRLKEYLKKCGFKSNIGSLENWIELMSVTGVMHGGTLSMTRLVGDSDIMRYRNRNAKYWDLGDINLIGSTLATVVGMEDGRHVGSSTIDTYAPELQAVLAAFDEKSSKMKKDYETAIMEDLDVFNNYGWILSDFCPDGFDGKQLTMTTYI